MENIAWGITNLDFKKLDKIINQLYKLKKIMEEYSL